MKAPPLLPPHRGMAASPQEAQQMLWEPHTCPCTCTELMTAAVTATQGERPLRLPAHKALPAGCFA